MWEEARLHRRTWGFWFILFEAFCCVGILFFRKIQGHYWNYTLPAHAMWRGQDPYGIVFPGSPGGFFHSPALALFYYGIFDAFPPLLGQFLYQMTLVLAFFGGVLSFVRVLRSQMRFPLENHRLASFLWIMLGAEMIGGLVALKVDVLIVGLTLWTVSQLLEERPRVFAFMLMGFFGSAKIQSLVLFGFLLLPLLLQRPRLALRAGIPLAVGGVAGFALPFAVLPKAFATQVTLHWMEALQSFVASGWLDGIFQHQYAFVVRGLKIPMALETANRISMGLAAAILVFLGTLAWKGMGWRTVLVAGLGLGSGWIVCCSPLIQSNSYVLYTPLALAVFLFSDRLGIRPKMLFPILLVAFLFISFFYSQLTPPRLYRFLYDSGVKPIGVLLLATCLCTYLVQLYLGRKEITRS